MRRKDYDRNQTQFVFSLLLLETSSWPTKVFTTNKKMCEFLCPIFVLFGLSCERDKATNNQCLCLAQNNRDITEEPTINVFVLFGSAWLVLRKKSGFFFWGNITKKEVFLFTPDNSSTSSSQFYRAKKS